MKKLYLILSLFGSMLCASCSDFLDAYSQSMVIPRTVYDLDEVLLGSVYLPSSEISTGPSGSSTGGFFNILDDDVNTGLGKSSDNNTASGWRNCVQFLFGYFAWQQEVGSNYNETNIADDSQTWDDLYKRINYANIILDEITELPHETDDENATYLRVQAEAHFLRAQFYFILANLYGDAYSPNDCASKPCVPLKLTPYVEHDKDKDTQFQRASVKEIYDQIVKDLLIAEDLFKQSPQAENHRLHRASIESVDLLLSRVYLYMQEWELAASKADAVIQSPNFSLAGINFLNNSSAFLTESNPEIIFSQGPNYLSPFSIFSALPGDFCVSSELYNLYDKKDKRHDNFFGTPASNDSIPLANKYQRGTFKSHISSSFMLRLSEAFLNKAEACAILGGEKEKEAIDLLNTLRSNRITDYSDCHYTGKELVQQIRDERRKELCFEGHRWFDLRRYAVCTPYPYSKRIIHVYNACSDNSAFLYSQSFCLEEHDLAYTFSIPNSILDFDNIPMEDNPRNDRKPMPSQSTSK